MSASSEDDRFCPECGVSLDLHYGDDDCDGAEGRARLAEAFDSIGRVR